MIKMEFNSIKQELSEIEPIINEMRIHGLGPMKSRETLRPRQNKSQQSRFG